MSGLPLVSPRLDNLVVDLNALRQAPMLEPPLVAEPDNLWLDWWELECEPLMKPIEKAH